ncbi:MAG TPA: extracellular solute-binding protein [Alphaproteobacteria bacterium]
MRCHRVLSPFGPMFAVVLLLVALPARADEPAVSKITPELVAAAAKEGKVVFYTSVEIKVGEAMAKAFQAKYPGITVQTERSGSERIFQRLSQETAARIYTADVVNSSDAAHFIMWKREGWLAPVLPEDVALHFPPATRDADGMYAPWRATLSVIGYNTSLVKPEQAPRSFADLLDPKWSGRIVKAHPGYSGTILTATFQMARDLGWDYFEKLARQRVMQVQSANEPPKKLALGERAIMADGVEYQLLIEKEHGDPVEAIYPSEGTPLVISPSAVMKNAPHPNAARLFQLYLFTAEAQQLLVDMGALRSLHDQVKEAPNHTPLAKIKLMKEDAAAVVDQVDDIKTRYAKYFGT